MTAFETYFLDYCHAVGFTQTAIDAARLRLNVLNDMLPESAAPLEKCVAGEVFDENGKRNWLGFWFLSRDAVYEAHFFLSKKVSIDGVGLAGAVAQWVLKADDFTSGNATEDSRVNLQIAFSGSAPVVSILGEISASGTNAQYLYDVAKEYIIPNSSAYGAVT